MPFSPLPDGHKVNAGISLRTTNTAYIFFLLVTNSFSSIIKIRIEFEVESFYRAFNNEKNL